MFGHLALDFLDGQPPVRGAQDVRQAVLREVERNLAPDQRGEGEQL